VQAIKVDLREVKTRMVVTREWGGWKEGRLGLVKGYQISVRQRNKPQRSTVKHSNNSQYTLLLKNAESRCNIITKITTYDIAYIN
jgi:putative IMPACT (imprinted ancient) family translation regulator